MKLINKGGVWQFQNTSWLLPSEGLEGTIEDKTTGKVLHIQRFSSGSKPVRMRSRDPKKSEKQNWVIGKTNDDGWFTITNQKSGYVLSSIIKRTKWGTRLDTEVSGDYGFLI